MRKLRVGSGMICPHNRGKEERLEGKTQELCLNPRREEPPGSCLPARAELGPPSPSWCSPERSGMLTEPRAESLGHEQRPVSSDYREKGFNKQRLHEGCLCYLTNTGLGTCRQQLLLCVLCTGPQRAGQGTAAPAQRLLRVLQPEQCPQGRGWPGQPCPPRLAVQGTASRPPWSSLVDEPCHRSSRLIFLNCKILQSY